MKKLGLVVAGLCLTVAGASANEAALPAQTMRITTGKIVAILQMPTSLSGLDSKTNFAADDARVLEGKTVIFTGHASLQASRAGQQFLKITADQITIGMEANKEKSVSANGKVVIQVQQDGKLMQIMADSIVLGPQPPK